MAKQIRTVSIFLDSPPFPTICVEEVARNRKEARIELTLASPKLPARLLPTLEEAIGAILEGSPDRTMLYSGELERESTDPLVTCFPRALTFSTRSDQSVTFPLGEVLAVRHRQLKRGEELPWVVELLPREGPRDAMPYLSIATRQKGIREIPVESWLRGILGRVSALFETDPRERLAARADILTRRSSKATPYDPRASVLALQWGFTLTGATPKLFPCCLALFEDVYHPKTRFFEWANQVRRAFLRPLLPPGHIEF